MKKRIKFKMLFISAFLFLLLSLSQTEAETEEWLQTLEEFDLISK